MTGCEPPSFARRGESGEGRTDGTGRREDHRDPHTARGRERDRAELL
jgi:hypothetical protein